MKDCINKLHSEVVMKAQDGKKDRNKCMFISIPDKSFLGTRVMLTDNMCY